MLHEIGGLHQCAQRRRPTARVWAVEALEGRALLSHVASVPDAAELHSARVLRPTQISLQASTQTTAAGPRVTLTAGVRVPGVQTVSTAGHVVFSVVAPGAERLGASGLDRTGHATIVTTKLARSGTFEIQAEFIPSLRGYARSSVRLEVSTGPAAVTSFRIGAAHYFGAPGTPITFTVTALNAQRQRVTGYTGTIALFSPTNKPATIEPRIYTFTTADQGAHTFVNGLTFHKGGAEVLKVHQVSNTRIIGAATFG